MRTINGGSRYGPVYFIGKENYIRKKSFLMAYHMFKAREKSKSQVAKCHLVSNDGWNLYNTLQKNTQWEQLC